MSVRNLTHEPLFYSTTFCFSHDSIAPSISKEPSVAPTVAPSAEPSAPPTGSLYYPDWIHETQVCVNDGADPSFMKRLQRDNYLYRSKEECCQNHFWWRITQVRSKPSMVSTFLRQTAGIILTHELDLFTLLPFNSVWTTTTQCGSRTAHTANRRRNSSIGSPSTLPQTGPRVIYSTRSSSVARISSGTPSRIVWPRVPRNWCSS